MKKMVVALLLAFGVMGAQASDTVRIGSKVLAVGDSEGKVYQVAGKPVRRERVENVYGASNGYRFDYEQTGKTIQIYVYNGRVSHIEEIFD